MVDPSNPFGLPAPERSEGEPFRVSAPGGDSFAGRAPASEPPLPAASPPVQPVALPPAPEIPVLAPRSERQAGLDRREEALARAEADLALRQRQTEDDAMRARGLLEAAAVNLDAKLKEEAQAAARAAEAAVYERYASLLKGQKLMPEPAPPPGSSWLWQAEQRAARLAELSRQLAQAELKAVLAQEALEAERGRLTAAQAQAEGRERALREQSEDLRRRLRDPRAETQAELVLRERLAEAERRASEAALAARLAVDREELARAEHEAAAQRLKEESARRRAAEQEAARRAAPEMLEELKAALGLASAERAACAAALADAQAALRQHEVASAALSGELERARTDRRALEEAAHASAIVARRHEAALRDCELRLVSAERAVTILTEKLAAPRKAP